MTKGIPKKRARSILSTANKYQDKIILLTFFPFILMFLLFICVTFITNPGISKSVLHVSFLGPQRLIRQFPWIIDLLTYLVLLASLIAAYFISHNMVGAFGRIIRELDEIIAGRSQKMITSRPDDGLTKDLLKRINVLVKYYVENKNAK